MVDDADFKRLSRFKWLAHYEPKMRKWYVARNVYRKVFRDGKQLARKQRMIYMGRVIMRTPPGKVCCYLNGIVLDHRRKNLRNVSRKWLQRRRRAGTRS